jgi:hypothetical protein
MYGSLDATVNELFGSSPELLADKRLWIAVKDALDAQEALASKFERKEISPVQLQESALGVHRQALRTIREILGEDEFYKIFGEEANNPELLADPKPFFARYERHL